MTTFLITFLRAMELAVPPPRNCHHALTYAQFGSDVEGWQEKLALQINKGGTFTCFFLDEDDFGKEPGVLAAEIAEMVARPDPSAQIGVGFAQYLDVNGVNEGRL